MQPIIIEDSIAIAANTVNANVIASNASLRRYLRAPFPAQGKLLVSQSAAGLLIDFDYGSKNVVANSAPRVTTIIEDPQDLFNDEFFVNEGDQLVLRANNPTAGALTLRYKLILFPWEGAELPPDTRTMQQGPITVNAAAVDQQMLDGLRYERSPVDAYATLFTNGSAAGLLRAFNVDMQNISPASAVAAGNRMPMDPFEKTIEGVEVPEDKLQELVVSNPTGGALSFWWKLKLRETVRT